MLETSLPIRIFPIAYIGIVNEANLLIIEGPFFDLVSYIGTMFPEWRDILLQTFSQRYTEVYKLTLSSHNQSMAHDLTHEMINFVVSSIPLPPPMQWVKLDDSYSEVPPDPVLTPDNTIISLSRDPRAPSSLRPETVQYEVSPIAFPNAGDL